MESVLIFLAVVFAGFKFTDSKKYSLPDETLNLYCDSIHPCELQYPDTAIFDIQLDDATSYFRAIGKHYELITDKGVNPHLSFATSNKREMLTLLFSPGASQDEYSEFEVKYFSDSNKIVSTLQTTKFVSGKGISLGMSKNEVIQKIGHCFQTTKQNEHGETMTYSIDYSTHSIFLKRYNEARYHGEYEFVESSLIRFKFGFVYP